MAIREIARMLYRLQQQVEELERSLQSEPPGTKRDAMGQELRRLRAEHRKVKAILEGEKAAPSRRSRL
ncbi:MAG: hypothetical protein JRJ12_16815 [Deltaproteobacteria bacterium]|nr:hypothetical protein [Deltaproteobacteria bacterium]MBW2071066.1 hypothetical protein [Deltaproteobacteria bacterium]